MDGVLKIVVQSTRHNGGIQSERIDILQASVARRDVRSKRYADLRPIRATLRREGAIRDVRSGNLRKFEWVHRSHGLHPTPYNMVQTLQRLAE